MIKYSFKRTLSAFALITVSAIGSYAMAEDDYGHHHGMGPMNGMGMMDGTGMMGHHGDHMGDHMEHRKEWGHGFMGMESGYMTGRLRRIWNLDLNDEEKKKIRTIERELRATVWQHKDAIEEISDELFKLYKADPRDAKAIGKVYAKIFDHQRQIIEAQIEAGDKAEAVLTKEQRRTFKHWGPKPKWGGG